MDIEDLEDLAPHAVLRVPEADRQDAFLKFMVAVKYERMEDFTDRFNTGMRKFKLFMFNKNKLRALYEAGDYNHETFEHFCIRKSSKSHSGVCVIATIMAPEFHFTDSSGSIRKQKFTCKYDCFFCPDDPRMARSYPAEEPVPKLGQENDFDVVRQAHSRMTVLAKHHHNIDKLEWLILGGTWSSFPREYREEYHHDIFYAANLWSEGFRVMSHDDYEYVRPKYSLEMEMSINRKATCRVIGITVETRPDEITLDELRFMRRLGTTRIQMGMQHTNNKILKKINRKCSIEQCMEGLRLALINGFKVDTHWMPDLPGSSSEEDIEMFRQVFTDERLRSDQVKIYPCQVLQYTRIKKWYDAGTYVPYAETDPGAMVKVIAFAKSMMPESIRTNRIVRDFPPEIVKGGLQRLDMGDMVLRQLKSERIKCRCIRCREVRRELIDYSKAEIIVREFRASGGDEYFISMEAEDKLLGFCRLRINPPGIESEQMEELHGCALIRELHVYGVNTSRKRKTQHRGFGKRLVQKAEEIARAHGMKKIAVISGIGVQDYYNKLGYEDGFFMIKQLTTDEDEDCLVMSDESAANPYCIIT